MVRRYEILYVKRNIKKYYIPNAKLTAPVVHEHHAENMFVRLRHGNRFSQLVSGTHEKRHLQLDIHEPTGAELGRLVCS